MRRIAALALSATLCLAACNPSKPPPASAPTQVPNPPVPAKEFGRARDAAADRPDDSAPTGPSLEVLRAALGKKLGSAEVAALKTAMVDMPEYAESSLGLLLSWNRKGLSLYFNNQRTCYAATAFRNSVSSGTYKGELPFGLSSVNDRPGVETILGSPSAVRDFGYWEVKADYLALGISVGYVLDGEAGRRDRLESITLIEESEAKARAEAQSAGRPKADRTSLRPKDDDSKPVPEPGSQQGKPTGDPPARDDKLDYIKKLSPEVVGGYTLDELYKARKDAKAGKVIDNSDGSREILWGGGLATQQVSLIEGKVVLYRVIVVRGDREGAEKESLRHTATLGVPISTRVPDYEPDTVSFNGWSHGDYEVHTSVVRRKFLEGVGDVYFAQTSVFNVKAINAFAKKTRIASNVEGDKGMWNRTSAPPTEAKVPSAEVLLAVLGKGRGSVEVLALKTAMVERPRFDEFASRSSLTWESKGLCLSFDKERKCSSVVAYGDEASSRMYGGELPYGLSFGDDGARVEKLLGPPPRFGRGEFGVSAAAYPDRGIWIAFGQTRGGGRYDRIHCITLTEVVPPRSDPTEEGPSPARERAGWAKAARSFGKFGVKVEFDGASPANPLSLKLDGVTLDDADVGNVAALTPLRELTLMRVRLPADGLRRVAGLSQLKTLNLTDMALSDDRLADLAGAAGLKTLTLWSNRDVTDAGLRHLEKLAALEDLNLALTATTDAGLKSLAKLRSLKTLNLAGTNVTAGGVGELKRAVPGLKVIHYPR